MPPPPPTAPPYRPTHPTRAHNNHKYYNENNHGHAQKDNHDARGPKNEMYDDEPEDYDYNNQYRNVPLTDYDYDYDADPPIKYHKSKSKEQLIKVRPISFAAFINKLSPGFKFIKEYDIWHHHHHVHHHPKDYEDIGHYEEHEDDRDIGEKDIGHRLKQKPSYQVSKTKVVPMDVDVYEIDDPEDKVNDIDEVIEGDIVEGA